MTIEEIIQHGETTGAFINSDTGKAVFIELGQKYFAEFKSATTPEAANAAWAKARALDELQTALQAVADAGTFEKMQLQKAEAASKRSKRPL